MTDFLFGLGNLFILDCCVWVICTGGDYVMGSGVVLLIAATMFVQKLAHIIEHFRLDRFPLFDAQILKITTFFCSLVSLHDNRLVLCAL